MKNVCGIEAELSKMEKNVREKREKIRKKNQQ